LSGFLILGSWQVGISSTSASASYDKDHDYTFIKKPFIWKEFQYASYFGDLVINLHELEPHWLV